MWIARDLQYFLTYRTTQVLALEEAKILAFRNKEFCIERQAERNEFLKRLILQFSLHKFRKLIQRTLCILSPCHVYNFLRSVAIFQKSSTHEALLVSY